MSWVVDISHGVGRNDPRDVTVTRDSVSVTLRSVKPDDILRLCIALENTLGGVLDTDTWFPERMEWPEEPGEHDGQVRGGQLMPCLIV